MCQESDDPLARFRRLEGLYQGSLDLTESERRAYLEKECAGDPALRLEIEDLLAPHSRAGDFLSVPAFDLEARRASPDDAPTYEESIAISRDILRIDQKFIQAWVWMGQSYSQQGRHVPAITALEKAASLDGGRIETMSALGYSYAVAGRADNARRIIAEFRGQVNLQGRHYFLATIQAGLGDRSAALAELDEAYRDRESPVITRIKLDPKLDLLRNEPRFISLLQWIGLG